MDDVKKIDSEVNTFTDTEVNNPVNNYVNNDNETNVKPKNNRHDGTPNLIPLNKRTKEERTEIGIIGGKASGVARRKKKTMQQMAQWLLEKNMSDEMIAETIADVSILMDENGEIDKSGNAVLMARMLQEATQGNVKAMELFRDTSGNKPTDKVQLETITDADRSMMEKVSKRLGNISTD